MKTASAPMSEPRPRYEFVLHQDDRHNWFCSFTAHFNDGRLSGSTATYTTPKEALDEAWRRAARG